MNVPNDPKEPEPIVVFNRPDCPYGCGAPLPPNLRWQATPCPGCGRPLHPLGSIVDDEGQAFWPPAGIPRPAEEGRPGVRVEYVVTEEEARERRTLASALTWKRLDKADERLLQGCGLILLIVAAVVVFLVVRALL